ncbi:MAG: hypothetical protein J7515_05060 [Caulobacter sp.]|nr:hypothetical protein [Caulobacter sp.]
MLLSVALLAATLQGAPPPAQSNLSDQIVSDQSAFYASKQEIVEAIRARQACRVSGLDYAVNAAPGTRAAVKKLGDLPTANHTLTVLRSVDGCPVSSTVRFNVDQPPRR